LKPSLPPYFLYLFWPPTLTEGGESKKCVRFARKILFSPPSKPWHLLVCYGFKYGGNSIFRAKRANFFCPPCTFGIIVVHKKNWAPPFSCQPTPLPQPTLPLKASHLHLSHFTVGGPWVEGEGGYERGGKVLHLVRLKQMTSHEGLFLLKSCQRMPHLFSLSLPLVALRPQRPQLLTHCSGIRLGIRQIRC